MHVGGGRDHVLDVDRHALQALLVQIRDEDRVPVRDYEKSAGMVVRFTCVIVYGQDISLDTSADVGCFKVCAGLGTKARGVAFVDISTFVRELEV